VKKRVKIVKNPVDVILKHLAQFYSSKANTALTAMYAAIKAGDRKKEMRMYKIYLKYKRLYRNCIR